MLVDDPTLVLTGNYIGNNLFFEVTLPGGSLQLGDATTTAALNANQFGRISLVADGITVGNAGSTITAPFGTVELAPFSAIHTSVAGTSAAGQLLIDPTLLSIINGGTSQPRTLRIGGFTDVTGPTVTGPAASTTGITIDGPVDLTNTDVRAQPAGEGIGHRAGRAAHRDRSQRQFGRHFLAGQPSQRDRRDRRHHRRRRRRRGGEPDGSRTAWRAQRQQPVLRGRPRGRGTGDRQRRLRTCR